MSDSIYSFRHLHSLLRLASCVCVLAVRVSRWRRRVRRPQQRGAAVPVALAGGRRGSRDTTSRASQKYRDPGVYGLRAATIGFR